MPNYAMRCIHDPRKWVVVIYDKFFRLGAFFAYAVVDDFGNLVMLEAF